MSRSTFWSSREISLSIFAKCPSMSAIAREAALAFSSLAPASIGASYSSSRIIWQSRPPRHIHARKSTVMHSAFPIAHIDCKGFCGGKLEDVAIFPDFRDDFLEFLFSGSEIQYEALKAKAQQQEDLPRFTLKGVTLTFNLDADYQVVNTRYTRNVVGIVEGTDGRLKDTYVPFGAHYDHLGYLPGALPAGQTDRIYNGADDDGSGTTALIALARAFAQGPKTKRSLIFVWHAGEEIGLHGSKYFTDHPTVPLEKIVAQLNVDMIGRNHDNLASESNTVYLVDSDRISSELHQILLEANAGLAKPMTLNYQLNEPTDPERVYYRSDHYSYAAKGIPIIFFTTFLHPDYHRVTDSVDKIKFEKLAHIARLVYETGRRVADLDHEPVHDFKGPHLAVGSAAN